MAETQGKTRTPQSIVFDSLNYIKFPTVTLSSTTQNNSVVTARMYVPTTVKIYRVQASFVSGSPAGTVSVNIVQGTAAEVANSGATKFLAVPIPDTDYANQPTSPGAAAYPPAYATAGQHLFLADRAITVAADTSTILTPDDDAATTGAYAPGTPGKAYDSLWGPGGTELTLRLPCSGATGGLEVGILCKFYDPAFTKPVLAGFNPATDIP